MTIEKDPVIQELYKNLMKNVVFQFMAYDINPRTRNHAVHWINTLLAASDMDSKIAYNVVGDLTNNFDDEGRATIDVYIGDFIRWRFVMIGVEVSVTSIPGQGDDDIKTLPEEDFLATGSANSDVPVVVDAPPVETAPAPDVQTTVTEASN